MIGNFCCQYFPVNLSQNGKFLLSGIRLTSCYFEPMVTHQQFLLPVFSCYSVCCRKTVKASIIWPHHTSRWFPASLSYKHTHILPTKETMILKELTWFPLELEATGLDWRICPEVDHEVWSRYHHCIWLVVTPPSPSTRLISRTSRDYVHPITGAALLQGKVIEYDTKVL